MWIREKRGKGEKPQRKMVLNFQSEENCARVEERMRGERRSQRTVAITVTGPPHQPKAGHTLQSTTLIGTVRGSIPHPTRRSIQPPVHLQHHGATSIWDGVFHTLTSSKGCCRTSSFEATQPKWEHLVESANSKELLSPHSLCFSRHHQSVQFCHKKST